MSFVSDWPDGAFGGPVDRTISPPEAAKRKRIMTVKIGFTGTQAGMSPKQKSRLRYLLTLLRATEFHHGDCVGADAEAHIIAMELDLKIVVHPPESDAKRAFCEGYDEIRPPDPYLVRNEDIVRETECLIAAPLENSEHSRSGSWATVRSARKLHRPRYIIFRNGDVTKDRGS